MLVYFSGSISNSLKPDGSSSDSSELTIGCFPLDLLGEVFGPNMFEVTSGYSVSVSEKVLFLRERRLIAELETGAVDS